MSSTPKFLEDPRSNSQGMLSITEQTQSIIDRATKGASQQMQAMITRDVQSIIDRATEGVSSAKQPIMSREQGAIEASLQELIKSYEDLYDCLSPGERDKLAFRLHSSAIQWMEQHQAQLSPYQEAMIDQVIHLSLLVWKAPDKAVMPINY